MHTTAAGPAKIAANYFIQKGRWPLTTSHHIFQSPIRLQTGCVKVAGLFLFVKAAAQTKRGDNNGEGKMKLLKIFYAENRRKVNHNNVTILKKTTSLFSGVSTVRNGTKKKKKREREKQS
jgi:hypothetical protein